MRPALGGDNLDRGPGEEPRSTSDPAGSVADGVTPVTLFADFACPYCYLTEAALVRSALSSGAAVRFRAFEREPGIPRPPVLDPREEWDSVIRPAAEELGLEMAPRQMAIRTGKAHEASAFAAEQGRVREMRDAIYRAFWRDGADVGRIDVLTGLWKELGGDPLEMKIALDIDRLRERVDADVELARRLRVPDIPLVFVGSGPGARVLFGLQTPAALDEAVRRG